MVDDVKIKKTVLEKKSDFWPCQVKNTNTICRSSRQVSKKFLPLFHLHQIARIQPVVWVEENSAAILYLVLRWIFRNICTLEKKKGCRPLYQTVNSCFKPPVKSSLSVALSNLGVIEMLHAQVCKNPLFQLCK